MGSGSSRLGSSPRTSKLNRTKQRLASFICGSSSTSLSSLREDCVAESLVDSVDCCQRIDDKLPSLSNESILTSSGGTDINIWSSLGSELGASSEISTTSSEHGLTKDDVQIESSSERQCFSGSVDESTRCEHRLGDIATTPSSVQIQPVSVNLNRYASSDNDQVSNDMHHIGSEVISPTPSNVQHGELERLPTTFQEINEIMVGHDSDSRRIPVVSDSAIASQSRVDEAIQEVMPSGLGLLVSDRVQAQSAGSVLHVDVASIFSTNTWPNINNEISTHEARRNNRRMFWDAFSSRSSRRHADFPAILLTSEDADLIGSRRRWLLDIGDDFFDDGVGVNSSNFGRRSRARYERHRNSRSEILGRLRGSTTESSHRTACPFDLHPDGSCSCELDEDASALTSISRFFLLAEALFEVLDEIHHQPESYSLSMLSVPAPELVVNSLPVRCYEKSDTAGCGDDVDQCYICLVDYEEGDKIRVLPCNHEYHMSCVDKWLKEVHGVCPLCRGDVRGEEAR